MVIITFEEIIEVIKDIKKLSTEKEVATAIGISPDNLVHRKNRKSIPHQKLINFCIANEISIDVLYKNKNTKFRNKDLTTVSKFGIVKIRVFESDELLAIPLVESKNSFNAFIDEETILIFDTEKNIFTKDGNYFLKYNNKLFAKKITTTFKNTYILQALDYTKDENIFELTQEEFNDIIFIGKIINIVSVN